MKAYFEWKCEHCCCIRVFDDGFPIRNDGKCGGYVWTAMGVRAEGNTLEISGVIEMTKSIWPVVFAVREAATRAGFSYVQWETDVGDGILKSMRYRLRQIFSREPDAAITDLSNLPIPAGDGAAGNEGFTAPDSQITKDISMSRNIILDQAKFDQKANRKGGFYDITFNSGEKQEDGSVAFEHKEHLANDGLTRLQLVYVQLRAREFRKQFEEEGVALALSSVGLDITATADEVLGLISADLVLAGIAQAA